MVANAEQIKSLIRGVLMVLFGGTIGVWMLKHGITIDDNFVTMATGIVFGVFSFVWSQLVHQAPPST